MMKSSMKDLFSFSPQKTYWAGILILTVCMLVNCWHSHLWGPDEPREAEIAREIVQDSSWIVPHFNGLPFVEKPPLYYDVSALVYSVFPHPGALRLHSALLGCLMLAALYFFAAKKCGNMTALCACAVCMSMPQFYRAAHWILLDIGVGAWVTAGLVCYGLWSLREEKDRGSTGLAILFFLFAALGMLTKGVITVVYLGSIILPHWLFFQRKKLPPVWTILFFLVPVGLWTFLLYRDGGIYFLHEHFINNTIGRLLHRNFHLEGSPVIISDVGHDSPVLFYFGRLPNMFGAVIVLLPFAIAWAWRTLDWKFFSVRLPDTVQRVWDLLTKPHEITPQGKSLLSYLILWSFVPVFVFSIPAIKEVTYLLPSYAGVALLVIGYAVDRLSPQEEKMPWLCGFILPLLCFALTVQLMAKISLILLFVSAGLIYAWLLFTLVRAIRRRDFSVIILPALAALIGGVMLGNTPELMQRSRLDRKCYCRLSESVWKSVGARQLYMMTPEESIRGALPFYGKKNVRVFKDEKELFDVVKKPGNHAVLLYEWHYKRLLKEPEFAGSIPAYEVIFPDFPRKADTFALLVPKSTK